MRFSVRLFAVACFCALLALGCKKEQMTMPAASPNAHSDVKTKKTGGKPELPQPPPPPPR